MAPRPSLSRLRKRPTVAEWAGDELISFAEAAALFFPDGPMTANALRIAFHRGELGAVEICGKIFTTPDTVRSLMTPRLQVVRSATSDPVDPQPRAPAMPEGIRRRVAAARARRAS